ncbi:MAG TPA: 2-phospho-L-lactate guanylyltransferase, partial [Chloroflexota bacterium]|nr:2-phospho-L-lactate guanylyltransferase [Chloroflexota bacterium]
MNAPLPSLPSPPPSASPPFPAWAVVVARTGPTAKSRLAPALGVSQRILLAQAMLADVVAACRQAGLRGPVVVTDGPTARERFARAGLPVVADGGREMNLAVRAGIATAAGAGAGAVLVLPGDVPLVTPADLLTLVSWAARGATVVGVATDRAGQGTNALVMRPPRAIQPGFGPRSAPRHLARARMAGASTHLTRLPSLVLDVDTPQDLALLRRSRPRGETGDFLASLGIPSPES